MSRIKINRFWIVVIIFLITFIAVAIYPSHTDPIQYVDRESGNIKTEKIAGENWLKWLYNNPVGEATLWALVKRKFVSDYYGEMMDKPSSAEKIDEFVEDFNIDMSESQKQEFVTFNEFFKRRLKHRARKINYDINAVISPADGKLFAWQDIANEDFIIKGYRFNINTFLNDPELSDRFKDGSLVVIRLAPNDYHRFHFPIDGYVFKSEKIDGDYYSVNPIALREKVEIFCLNKREYTSMHHPELGYFIMTEVGATMVGSIVQTFKGEDVLKGKEKGYFKFGGSTVVLIFEKDRLQIDQDLLDNTKNGLETLVKMGEQIGRINSQF